MFHGTVLPFRNQVREIVRIEPVDRPCETSRHDPFSLMYIRQGKPGPEVQSDVAVTRRPVPYH